MISSKVAPALSALLMWRRVPGAYMCVYGSIEGDAQEFDLLGWHHAAPVNGRGDRHEFIGPYRIELEERIPRRVPLSDLPHLVAGRGWLVLARGAGSTLAAFASSRRIGAPRLHEWIDMTDPHLRTKRISSRVAPASSAARMWRRVPSGFRLVQAAFKRR